MLLLIATISQAFAVDLGPEVSLPMGTAGARATRAPATASDGSPKGVTLAFNNARAVIRQDGVVHKVFAEEQRVVYVRRKGGAEDRTMLGTSTLPALAVDGRFVAIAWTEGPHVKVAMSDDGGSEMTTTTVATGSAPAGNPSIDLWRGGEEVRGVLAWHQGAPRGQKTVWASVLGEGWSKAHRLDGADKEAAFPTVAGTGDRAVVVWRDRRSASSTPTLHLARYTADGGWSDEQSTGLGGLDPSVCIDDRGTLHLGYQSRFRAMVTRWTGQGFAAPQVLDHQGLFVQVVCGEEGRMAAVWEHFVEASHFKDDSAKTMGLALSDDRGASWRGFDPARSQRGWIQSSGSLGDGALELVWTQNGQMRHTAVTIAQ